MKLIFFNNLIKKEIVKYANKKLKKNTDITSIQRKKEFCFIISKNIKNVAPDIAGIDKYIEYFVAQILLNPKKRAAVIHRPALLDPGIKANIWNIPIIKESLKEISFNFLLVLFLSEKKRSNEKIIAEQAINDEW